MKIKKLLQLSSAVILSLGSLLSLSMPLAHAATHNCTWTDASGIDNNFSTATNWANCSGAAPDAVPGDTYNLMFPGTAAGFDPVQDISSLTAGSITFSGGSYHITSSGPGTNTITISGGISDVSSGPNNEIDLNITLSGSQAFNGGASSKLILGTASDSLTIGSNTLTIGNAQVTGPIVGAGTLTVSDSHYPADVTGVDLTAASPGFTGSVSVTQGALFVDSAGALSSASQVTVANGAFLKGSGGVSSATVQSGGTVAPGHSPGCITASNFTISGVFQAQIGGTAACSAYDQLQVSGSVNVSNGTLQVSLVNGFVPSIGQSFEIINNTGGSAITGTFSGLAEGATFTSSGHTFQVSYKGGTGNDVVLTVINPPTSSGGAGSSKGSNAPGAPNTGFGAALASPTAVFAASLTTTAILAVMARRLKATQR